jgi:hypothetical protein
MSDAKEIELWIKLHAALCKRKWFRHAMRFLDDKQEKALMDEAIKIIKRSGAFAEK